MVPSARWGVGRDPTEGKLMGFSKG
jgi:hypothetical protein